MRESERLLQLARKCFEDAAESTGPTQMKIHAEMGHRYLAEAETAAAHEAKTGNGSHTGT